MTAFKQIEAGDDGWAEMETPVMQGYKMACCDCGLVHDINFTPLRITENNPDGSWKAEELDPEEYRIGLTVRRNNRSTGQIRRHMK